jgi:ABC-type nickel/cobalt efflux system permease component RcnA
MSTRAAYSTPTIMFILTKASPLRTAHALPLRSACMYASRFIVPERLFPILSMLSAVLVLGMGILLLVQRARAAYPGLAVVKTRSIVFHPVTAAPGSGGGPMHSHLPPGAAGEKIAQ